MRNFLIAKTPLKELLDDLKDNVTAFFKEELQLVQGEMSEKVGQFGRDMAILATGGFLAGGGLILLCAGIGLLLASGFESLGVDFTLAAFIGFAIVGIIVMAAGTAFISKGIKALSIGSLAPERTIQTISTPVRTQQTAEILKAPEQSSSELHKHVLITKERIREDKEELKYRLSPRHLKDVAVRHIKRHPFTWSSAALAGVLAGSVFVGRKFWKA
jgi:hypothetical protein